MSFITDGLKIWYEVGVIFTNLTLITKNATLILRPNLFDGAHPDTVDKKVWTDLKHVIILIIEGRVPIALNFFLEISGGDEPLKVLEAQLILNGAHGAHIIYALQNYGSEKSTFDDNAYTFSEVYIAVTWSYLHTIWHFL